MDNTQFQAYLTNLGKYNEGELIGKWVEFPTTHEEIQKALTDIGIDNKRYEEYFFTDYETDIDGLYEHLPEYAGIDELNYLASRLEELSDYEREHFEAALVMGENCGSVAELINLTENLDCYYYNSGVHDAYDLGHYWLEESGCYDKRNLLNLTSYFDYEKFGRNIMLEEAGIFSGKGYVHNTNERFVEVYNGINIPEEYVVTGKSSVIDRLKQFVPTEGRKTVAQCAERG